MPFSILHTRRALVIAAALLISACASQTSTIDSKPPTNLEPETTQPIPKAPKVLTEWETYQQVMGSIDRWQVQGKLGVRLPDNSGSVYFNWKQRPTDFAIHLSGPLGQGTSWIRGDHQRVSLEQSDRATIFADTPEELMHHSLGWWLPVSQLYYWIRAIPAPDSNPQSLSRHEDGTVKTLAQNDWQLEYSRYKSINGWPLPSKVIARHKDIKLTFIIKNWKLQ